MSEELVAETPQSVDLDGPSGPPRSYGLAVFLSIFMMGLGHVYVGRALRGMVLYAVCYPLWLVALAVILYLPVEHVNVIIAVSLIVGYKLYTVVDVVFVTRRQQGRPLRAYQKWWVYLLLYIGLLALPFILRPALTKTWVETYFLPTGGMADTIMAGDRFFVEKQLILKRPIRHGDVIVFYSEGPGSPIYSQRVIGLPGDVIEFRDEQLIRNGLPVDEPYVKYEDVDMHFPPELYNLMPVVVPDGEVFVAGDNRRYSVDSRSRGTTPVSDVIGHVMTIYWSSVLEAPEYVRGTAILKQYGIDDDNPPGKIRWDRFGNRITSGN